MRGSTGAYQTRGNDLQKGGDTLIQNFRFKVQGTKLRALLAVGCCFLLAGCISRSLTIKSEPIGAKIYLLDEYVGDTPYTFDPVWYGGYRIMLEKDGYDRLYEKRELKSPKKLWIPLDLFMELMPFEVRDDQVWEFTMQPAEALPVPSKPKSE